MALTRHPLALGAAGCAAPELVDRVVSSGFVPGLPCFLMCGLLLPKPVG